MVVIDKIEEEIIKAIIQSDKDKLTAPEIRKELKYKYEAKRLGIIASKMCKETDKIKKEERKKYGYKRRFAFEVIDENVERKKYKYR